MTLMAGPVDTRVAPTRVNDLATSNPITWFERNLIATVPARYPVAGRRVYPGFVVQTTALMAMNPLAHRRPYRHVHPTGDGQKQTRPRRRQDLLRRVFRRAGPDRRVYLETGQPRLPAPSSAQGRTGQMRRGGWCRSGRHPPHHLFTVVEGERDDICSVGQTGRAPASPRASAHQQVAGDDASSAPTSSAPFSGRKWTNRFIRWSATSSCRAARGSDRTGRTDAPSAARLRRGCKLAAAGRRSRARRRGRVRSSDCTPPASSASRKGGSSVSVREVAGLRPRDVDLGLAAWRCLVRAVGRVGDEAHAVDGGRRRHPVRVTRRGAGLRIGCSAQ